MTRRDEHPAYLPQQRAGFSAHDIALGDYDSWGDAERIAVNVATLYREFSGDTTPPNPAHLFALMGEIWKKRRG